MQKKQVPEKGSQKVAQSDFPESDLPTTSFIVGDIFE